MLKYFNMDIWALPGIIFKDENVDDAAYRLLYERTHLDEIFWNSFILLETRTVQNLISTTDLQKQGNRSSERSLAFKDTLA